MEKVILAITVDRARALQNSSFLQDMVNDFGHSFNEALVGDITVLLMNDDIIPDDKDHVVDVSDVATLTAEAATLLRNARETSDGGFRMQYLREAELNLERILDRVTVITGLKEAQ